MTSPTRPALVSRDAAQRLPRLALLLFCAAYVLPGLFGRDPWRGADLSAFGQMLAMAQGRASWLAPALGGVPTDGALLPHWIGAASIALGAPWLDPALAARIPFALLLVLTLLAVWRACFNLSLSEPAQPLPFAFGGEANAVDYARAMADGALLALIATLGLLWLGHQTTPEIAQLAAVASFQWALSAGVRRPRSARAGLLIALPALAASGAPTMAMVLALGAVVLSLRQREPAWRSLAPWLVGSAALAALAAWPVHGWAWRMAPRLDLQSLARLWLWFLWPASALAAWTLWRWRRHLMHWHLALPLLSFGVALAASVVMDGADRPLLLGLPGIAVLAAFALPTLRRRAAAAIDWFSVFFFSLAAFVIWFYYVAAQTGTPAPAANSVARLVRGFEARWSPIELLFAAAGTLAWLWLVRWRTSHHRAVIWKSLVLPAGGVALCWLLAMTLWLPAIDHARSYRPLIERISRNLPADACIAAPDGSPSLVAALEYHAHRRVDASPQAANGRCEVLVLVRRGTAPPPAPVGWQTLATEQRPTERNEFTLVYRR
ncbi:MAG: hypothetical protein IPP87_02000 [Ideonella sp.]|nr:hypothetical protein [Ideonella sp.]